MKTKPVHSQLSQIHGDNHQHRRDLNFFYPQCAVELHEKHASVGREFLIERRECLAYSPDSSRDFVHSLKTVLGPFTIQTIEINMERFLMFYGDKSRILSVLLHEEIIFKWLELLVDVRLKLVLEAPLDHQDTGRVIQINVGYHESGPCKTPRLDVSNLSSGSNQHAIRKD